MTTTHRAPGPLNQRRFRSGLIAALLVATPLWADPPQPQTWDFEGPAALAAPGMRILAGNATVSNQVYYSGNASLEILPESPIGQVAFALPKKTDVPIVFADLRLLPMALPAGQALNTVAAGGALAGFVQVSASGELLAYDGGGLGKWVDTGVVLPAKGGNGAVDNWVRLTFRLDRIAGDWDLYVEGEMVAAGLGLTKNADQRLVLFGNAQASIYVDDVTIGSDNPLFEDADKDGLPDAWEKAHHAATANSGANGLVNGSNGSSTLAQQYLQDLAVLAQYRALLNEPIVFVHPTIRSFTDLGAILTLLATTFPSENSDAENLLLQLAAALPHATPEALAGLGTTVWQIAPDLASAEQMAPDGAQIVVFPSISPYVATKIDPQGKNLTVHCLEGVVFSTPETQSAGQQVLVEKRAWLTEALGDDPSDGGQQLLQKLWLVSP